MVPRNFKPCRCRLRARSEKPDLQAAGVWEPTRLSTGIETIFFKAAHEFAPKGLDAALLTAGGKAAEQSNAALREGGRAVYPNGVEDAPQARDGLKVMNYNGEPDPQTFDKLNELIEGGPFEVHIARTFKLEEVAEAQRALESHYLGKLALVLS